jgi:hypothetical protein
MIMSWASFSRAALSAPHIFSRDIFNLQPPRISRTQQANTVETVETTTQGNKLLHNPAGERAAHPNVFLTSWCIKLRKCCRKRLGIWRKFAALIPGSDVSHAAGSAAAAAGGASHISARAGVRHGISTRRHAASSTGLRGGATSEGPGAAALFHTHKLNVSNSLRAREALSDAAEIPGARSLRLECNAHWHTGTHFLKLSE